MTLFRGETVYDHPDRAPELIGDGKNVVFAGENRPLSRLPPEPSHDPRGYSKVFGAVFPNIPRSEWSARLQHQLAVKGRISDHQNYDPDNQGSHPICWSAGTCHAGATSRVMMGLPFVQLSAGCLATEITGGVSSGGYEGNAVKAMVARGVPSSALWPYQSSRPTVDKAEIAADRQNHVALEVYECDGFDEFATALLLGFCPTVSYNWWSHVVSLADLVEIESGSFGVRIRNNWGTSYGAKNDLGFGGYAVFREGKGTPSGGFAFRQMTPSEK